MKPSYVTVLAVAHPAGRPNNYKGKQLTVRDIKRLTEIVEQKEIPTFYEHDRSLMRTGKVIRFHLAKGDKLGIVALLDINSTGGAMVHRMMENGIYVGLSVQVEWTTDENGVINTRDILEVSYTRYPRLSDTRVDFISEMLMESRGTKLQREYDQLFEKIYKLMEAEKKEVPAATEEPKAAAGETPKEPESKPFPEIPESIPEEHRDAYQKFLAEETKKQEQDAKELQAFAKVAAKRKGVESFNLFGLDNPENKRQHVSDIRRGLLEVIKLNMAEKEEELKKPAATPTQTPPSSKPVTITDPPAKSAQQPAKAQKSDTVLIDLYMKDYVSTNK